MTKYIKILFSLLLLLTLGGCRDDFQWEGVEVDSDEYLLAFTTSTPDIEVMGATRADTESRDEIKNLTLVIFKDGVLWNKPIYFDGTDPKLSFIKPSVDSKGKSVPGSIKMPKSSVTNGDWYLFANAKTEIRSFMSSKDNGADISAEALLDGISYGTTTGITGDDQLNGTNDHVMWGMQGDMKVGVGDATQTNAIIIGLKRIYSRITVETNGDIKFKMTGARLNKWVASGTLKGAQSSLLSGTVSDTQDWMTPTSSNGLTWDSPSFTYTKSGQQLVASTYPYLLNKDAANENKMMMLVKGRFNSGSSDTPNFSDTDCFYAIPIPSCKRNGGWRLIINGALAAGQPTADAAIAKPGGLSVVFEDSEPKIHNIISDGENVLAVVDSVKFNADGTIDGSTTNKTGQILAKARQKGVPSAGLEFKSGTYSWITVGSAWSTTELGADDSNGLFTYELTRNITVSKNEGSERSAVYTVKLEGTELTRDVVVYQKGVENLKYSNYVDIKLTITGGASPVSNLDYIKFVNPKGSTATIGVECQGIQPEENGGRVRNLGLHMPMPNGGDVTYTYTISTSGKTGNGDIYLNGTNLGKSHEFVFTDSEVPSGGTTKYSYVTQSDKIEIKAGDNVYSLDLYHTGFFHINGSTWYYYEVMQQGERDLYWLDRNLGATSAGMGVRTSTGVMTSTTWPIMGEKAMGDYYDLDKANSEKPKGWDVPTYAQMRSMTVSSGFTINRMSNPSDHKTYLAPTFTFHGKEDGEVKSYSSYFPQNRLSAGGDSYGGDPEAGYYLTKTPSGTAGWYQTMQFMGMNVTAQNIQYKDGNQIVSQASLRCCTGSYDPQSDAETYSCNVKGYTHVFLYYLNSDGSKTYLTTWPGEQIAVYESELSNDVGRYHPFEIEPTMSYNKERLYVIFNTVNTKGVRVYSNMSNADVKARRGTKFKNGGNYDKWEDSTTLPDVEEGNWVANENIDYSSWYVNVTGAWNSYADNGVHPNASGISKHEGLAIGNSTFRIKMWNKTDGTIWRSNGSQTITQGSWVTITTASDTEMKISGAQAGDKFDVEWNCKTNQLKVTKVGSATTDYSSWWVNVMGEFNGDKDNGVQPNSAGESKHTSQAIGNKGFKIKVYDGGEHWYSNGGTLEQGKWITLPSCNDNSTQMTISGASAGDLFDVEWKCATNQIKVTKVAVSTDKYLVVRAKTSEIGTSLNYIYAYNGNNEYFGAYNSAPTYSGNDGTYKYWKIKVTSEVSSLEGVILKSVSDGDGTGRLEFDGSSSTLVAKETNSSTLSSYGADYLFTIKTVSRGSWYIKVNSEGMGWTKKEAQPGKDGIAKIEDVYIKNQRFEIMEWRGSGSDVQYANNQNIVTDKWITVSESTACNMYVSGAGGNTSYDVYWNSVTKKIKVKRRNN
ncbi:MAG: hypothetical protein K2G67_01520 [Muribaculaceae bacterium]|nr:hypothetical protein [Muribaculaceae bacterium]